MVQIPENVLDKFREWNTSPFDRNIKYDKRMIQALFLVCLGRDKVLHYNANEATTAFIHGMKL